MDITMILLLATIATTVSMTVGILYQTWQLKKALLGYITKGRKERNDNVVD